MVLSRLYIYWHVKRFLKRSRNGVQGVSDASIDDAIQEMYDHDGDRLRAVMEDVQCVEYFRAARWCAEQKAFLWLAQSNVRGASPSTAELFKVFHDSFPAISRGGRFVEFASIGEDKHRLTDWGICFRRRWGTHFEALPKANALTDAELSERAAPRGSSRPPEAPRAPRRSERVPEAPGGSQRAPEAVRGFQKHTNTASSSWRVGAGAGCAQGAPAVCCQQDVCCC